jgi:predicted MPP superfamily phosphohydrolase
MIFQNLIKTIIGISIVGFIFFGYCYLETRWIKTNKIEIHSPEIPGSFNGKKIVFISDIHHGSYFSIERVSSLVNRINKLKPDIIVLGGDYVHRERKYIQPVFDEFRKLKSKYGIFAVLGNHDHWESADLTRKMMIINGIKICDNQSYWLKIAADSIKIGGVGDLWEDVQIPANTLDDVKQSDFCILISHNPDYLENIKTDLIDLSLSGHTHGGQMTLFGMWAPILPSEFGQKYRYGLINSGKMQSYISSGIGTITPPLRFFCRPEIVLITLKNR